MKQKLSLRRLFTMLVGAAALTGLSGCIASDRLLLVDASSGRDGLPDAVIVATSAGPIGLFARDAERAFREIVDLDLPGATPRALPGRHYLEPWTTREFQPNRAKLIHAACSERARNCGYALLVGGGSQWTQYVVNASAAPNGVATIGDIEILKRVFLSAVRARALGTTVGAGGLEIFNITHQGAAFTVQVQPLRVTPAAPAVAAQAAALLGAGQEPAAPVAEAEAPAVSAATDTGPALVPSVVSQPILDDPLNAPAGGWPQPTQRQIPPPPPPAEKTAEAEEEKPKRGFRPTDGFGSSIIGGHGSLGGF